MDKIDKAREEICKDCIFWTVIENCTACLFNNLKDNKWQKKKETDQKK